MNDMTNTMNSPTNSKELQNKMDSVNHVSVVIQFDPQSPHPVLSATVRGQPVRLQSAHPR